MHQRAPAQLTVVTNPGVPATTAWQLDGGTADIVNVFEGSPSSFSSWSPPAWVANRNPANLSAIIYGAGSTSTMQSACSRASLINLGWTYVTPDVLLEPVRHPPPRTHTGGASSPPARPSGV